jgi:heterodisulfide reductase subunit D
MMDAMQEIIKNSRVWYCLDCGKCSAVCPITQWETREHTSPRLLVEKAIQGRADEIQRDHLFQLCLTCKRCSELCPSNVYFSEFLRSFRALAWEGNQCGECTHNEIIQTWGRMMTDPDLSQNRLGWLDDDCVISEDSDTVYFVGCLPYYATIFEKQGVEVLKIAKSVVKILNRLGIQPQVLADERCCGHDQLWQGDMDGFRRLAELNLEKLKAAKAKRIVTSCPECARTLKIDYPEIIGNHDLEVVHIAELLAESELFRARVESVSTNGRGMVTYQDPCRLGRHMGIYDAPREAIANLGMELVEMDRTRNTSLCCGTSCWVACGQVSKNIQVGRLKEARATGAELLITTCVKCQIHFKCAQNDPVLGKEIDIEIQDLATLVADGIA